MDDETRKIYEGVAYGVLTCIDPDPDREGLKDTPARMVRAWEEQFGGNAIDPASLITTFSETENYDQIIILRNIEFTSFCEHHILPFNGFGHIAYLPRKRVIGISKLARLLDCYARRLQIQERICQQVTQALDEYLKPLGSACILVAKHQCMSCRGIKKQESEMITSSLTGVFREPQAHHELLALIGPM